VMVTMVLLKVLWMYAWPRAEAFFALRRGSAIVPLVRGQWQVASGDSSHRSPLASHLKLFLPSLDADGFAGAFAGARVGLGALAANRQAATVAQATIVADLHQTLD